MAGRVVVDPGNLGQHAAQLNQLSAALADQAASLRAAVGFLAARPDLPNAAGVQAALAAALRGLQEGASASGRLSAAVTTHAERVMACEDYYRSGDGPHVFATASPPDRSTSDWALNIWKDFLGVPVLGNIVGGTGTLSTVAGAALFPFSMANLPGDLRDAGRASALAATLRVLNSGDSERIADIDGISSRGAGSISQHAGKHGPLRGLDDLASAVTRTHSSEARRGAEQDIGRRAERSALTRFGNWLGGLGDRINSSRVVTDARNLVGRTSEADLVRLGADSEVSAVKHKLLPGLDPLRPALARAGSGARAIAAMRYVPVVDVVAAPFAVMDAINEAKNSKNDPNLIGSDRVEDVVAGVGAVAGVAGAGAAIAVMAGVGAAVAVPVAAGAAVVGLGVTAYTYGPRLAQGALRSGQRLAGYVAESPGEAAARVGSRVLSLTPGGRQVAAGVNFAADHADEVADVGRDAARSASRGFKSAWNWARGR